MPKLVMSAEQQAAFKDLNRFIHSDPTKKYHVLRGFSGTGKTALVKYLLERLTGINAAFKMANPKHKPRDIALTALSNQAAGVLGDASNEYASTIHRFLSLTVKHSEDYSESFVVKRTDARVKSNYIILVDEISYANQEILDLIEELTDSTCKIIFIGDPCQLIKMEDDEAPGFIQGYPESSLITVQRSKGREYLTDLSSALRKGVTDEVFDKFTIDDSQIKIMNRKDFNRALITSMKAPGWSPSESLFLAWHNKRVQWYNRRLNEQILGSPDLQIGQRVINNSYIKGDRGTLSTGELTRITGIQKAVKHGVAGNLFDLTGDMNFFMPHSPDDKIETVRRLTNLKEYQILGDIKRNWIDLRCFYALTVDKSQGSTVNTVFIDLDDINECPKFTHKARLAYVAAGRAAQNIIMTGNINRR